MAKPEDYKVKDAVKIRCLHEYKVKDGTDDPVTYEKGKTYSVSPSSAAHLMRKSMATFEPLTKEDRAAGRKRGAYLGDVSQFELVGAD